MSPRKGPRNYFRSGRLLCLPAVCIAMLAAAGIAQELGLPNGLITRVASPDGAHILYGAPYQSGINDGPQLWIEDTRTHHRQMLLSIGSTLSARWSFDGSAFSVTDHWASDRARSFIYNANTLQRLDLGDRIMAADPEVARFTHSHSYFDVDRWEDSQHVFVHFHGHTDESPVVCFDFGYRVSRAGTVEKLSQSVFSIDQQTFCR